MEKGPGFAGWERLSGACRVVVSVAATLNKWPDKGLNCKGVANVQAAKYAQEKEVFWQCWECLSVGTSNVEEEFAGVYGQWKTAQSVAKKLRREGWICRIVRDSHGNCSVLRLWTECDVCWGRVEALTIDNVPQ